jgi:hypothetical protein
LVGEVTGTLARQKGRESRNSDNVKRDWLLEDAKSGLVEGGGLVVDSQGVLGVLNVARNINYNRELSGANSNGVFSQERGGSLSAELDGVQQNVVLQELVEGTLSTAASVVVRPLLDGEL